MARRPIHDPLERIATVLHAVSLAICAGVIFTTGVAAAVAFPTMRDLDPALSDFAAVDDHWMIAAGSVMIRMFSLTAVAAGACIVIGTLSFLLLVLRMKRRRGMVFGVRGAALAGLVVIFGHYAGVVLPRMSRTFDDFKESAVAGEIEQAEIARSAFSDDHPAASRELGAIAALSLVSSLLAAAPLSRRR